MYKLIACDLDETLLNDDTTICERNKKAVAQAIKRGAKFVLATGRGYNAVQKTLRDLNLNDKIGEYVISFNGACITENKNNRVLQMQGLSFKRVMELFQLGKQFDVCIHLYTKDKVYLYHADQDEINYMKLRHKFEIIDDQTDLDFLKKEDLPKVLFGKKDMSYLKQIAGKYRDNLKDLDVSYSSNKYIEFNHKNVNKGMGLKFLCQYLKIKPEETMALGDNWNDLSMIKYAGLGIGMKNTISGMEKECDVITDADYKNGGVGEAIERFVLEKTKN